MRLIDYLDKGASLGPDAPCFTTGEANLSYAEVQCLTSSRGAGAADGGDQTRREKSLCSPETILSPSLVFFGLVAREAAVWCPINPRNEAAENRYVHLDAFDCRALIFHSALCEGAGRGA